MAYIALLQSDPPTNASNHGFCRDTLAHYKTRVVPFLLFYICMQGFDAAILIPATKNRTEQTIFTSTTKHLQCEKLLGLAEGNTKKCRNKKSGESITPICYNVTHTYTFRYSFSTLLILVVFPVNRNIWNVHFVQAVSEYWPLSLTDNSRPTTSRKSLKDGT